ncbi:MAG: D-alanyl-D-alanine carboxypeptidase family protein [Clostridia bacterium]
MVEIYKTIEKSKIKYLAIITLSVFVCISMSYIFSSSFYYKANVNASSISVEAQVPVFAFESASQYLIEASTGKVLYANNENEKLLPASVTKVMSLLLIMQQIDSGKLSYSDKVVCSSVASKMGGSQIWFKEGEQLTIDEALKAICISSANDVVVSVSELIAGSQENFVKMMNDKAKELNMYNTHFVNCHGLDTDEHFTCAKDIAIMSRELINNHPNILKYTSIWQDTLRGGTFTLSNTNKLIKTYDGATGLKTGSTSKAMYNLSATATRNNTTYIAVVMKAPTPDIRLKEVKQLLDFAFANYEKQEIYTSDEIIDCIKVNKSLNSIAKLAVKDNIITLNEKGNTIDIDKKIIYNDKIRAPLKVNQSIGNIEIINKANGEKIAQSELIVKNEIPKSNYLDYFKNLIKIFILFRN